MSAWQLGLLLALVIVAGLAYVLWARSRAMERRTGLPKGEVIYADTEGWEACRPLFARHWRLAGKPDYLVRVGNDTIPVEVKPSRRAARPYEGDVLQLAAYCLLVEEVEGRPPPHGLLHYRDQAFRIPYDDPLHERLLAVMDEMRCALRSDDLPRSHDDPARCRSCGYQEVCGEALGDAMRRGRTFTAG
ncbi:MAG TPA: CRISPR-associated protein Cas4 [Chloroflexi bacterium]|jgi:CRISPR-associated exonuclease Cas4|nr:CRISPR-associated protein Cas4 [Chloroflexota bacterium]